jgi:hypothetical protein
MPGWRENCFQPEIRNLVPQFDTMPGALARLPFGRIEEFMQ